MTAENTACLNRAAELGEQHQRLEQGLVAAQHTVLADAVSMKRKEAEERDKMVQVSKNAFVVLTVFPFESGQDERGIVGRPTNICKPLSVHCLFCVLVLT